MRHLNVFSGKHLVGQLIETDDDSLSFKYRLEWLSKSDAIPLSNELPLTEQLFHGAPVVSFFQNLLPEGDTLKFISQALQISSGNVFGLLERFGGDTAGAFSILPDGMMPDGKPRYLPINPEVINNWFAVSKGIPLKITNGEQIRMSLSGAQDKMTVFIDQHGEFFLPIGTAPTSHIIKPSLTHRPDIPCTAINETMVMILAKETGFLVPDVRFDPELNAAIIARYDRIVDENGNLQRLHQNDLCQTLGVLSSKKYESEGGPSLKVCFDTVLKLSSQPAVDKKRLIEWLVFNILIGNMDSHAKNISLLISDNKTQLSPFYDMVCTAVYPNLSKKFAFKIGGENRPYWIRSRHWERLANDIDVKPRLIVKIQKDIIDKIERALPGVAKTLGAQTTSQVDLDIIAKVEAAIRKGLKTMLLRGLDNTEEDSDKQDNAAVDDPDSPRLS